MQAPPYPQNEADRLNALSALAILDTPPEERFDRLTRIAKRTFRVPIVLVSLVDAERQWFKSRQGLCACETARDISFCGHAILNDHLFVVPNARNDPRFYDNPLVIGEPKIRFYAGLPLTVLGGYRVGTLCIIDQSPRHLTSGDEQLMADLGHLAQQEIAAGQSTILDKLQQRNEEMLLLSRLTDFLQAALTLEEAFTVIQQIIGPLFPGCSGGIFTICASRNRVSQGAVWGQSKSMLDFPPHACWALRRGRSHYVTPARAGLRCSHAAADAATTLCIPMIAQGETLGLFFLSAPTTEALPESTQQLALTVAEQVGLAIANLHLRETLKNQHKATTVMS